LLGERMFSPQLWHPGRRRFAAGFAVGAFFAMMPAPFQMVAAALIAYITRVNIPAAIAGTWISNPLTFPLCIYAQYWLGCLLLGRGMVDYPGEGWKEILKNAPAPFFVGVIPSAVILAAVVYPLTLLMWDIVNGGIHRRAESRGRQEVPGEEVLPDTPQEKLRPPSKSD